MSPGLGAGHIRAIDRWLKWVAILGPVISGLAFGGVSYVAGYTNARQDIVNIKTNIADIKSNIVLIGSWKEKQEDFNKVVIGQISSLIAISKMNANSGGRQ